MKFVLSEEQHMEAIGIAEAIQQNAIASGSLIYRTEESLRSALSNNIRTCCSRLAFALAFGLTWNPSIGRSRHSSGCNLVAKRFFLKYDRAYGRPLVLLRAKLRLDLYYIQDVCVPDERFHDFTGWCMGSEVQESWLDETLSQPGYVVPIEALHPMDTLPLPARRTEEAA